MRQAIVKKLEWDSNFFGFAIGRLNRRKLTEKIMREALAASKKAKIKCLYLTADSNDPMSVNLAEANGFHFANFRMNYQFDFDLGHSFPQIRPHNYEFRRVKKTDLRQLMQISKNLYIDSRYYYDSHFPRKLCDRFYSEWIRTLGVSRSKNKSVFLLADRKTVIGYIGYEIERDNVHIVLVGIGERYQGLGAGKILLGLFLKTMFKQGFTKFEVVTQGRNIGSQRLYQAAGFKINSSEIDYHKWF